MDYIRLNSNNVKEIRHFYKRITDIRIKESKEKKLQDIKIKLDILIFNLNQFVRIIFENNKFNQFTLRKLIEDSSYIGETLNCLSCNSVSKHAPYPIYMDSIKKIRKLLKYLDNVKEESEGKLNLELLERFYKTVKEYGWVVLNGDATKKIKIASRDGFVIECSIDDNVSQVYKEMNSVRGRIIIYYGEGISKRFVKETIMFEKGACLSHVITWVIRLAEVKSKKKFDNIASQLFIKHGKFTLTFKDNSLVYLDDLGKIINKKKIHPLNVQHLKESPKKDGILVLFEKLDYLPVGKKFYDLGLFDYHGNIIWWADYPKSRDSDYHLSLEVIEDKIYTETFSSYTCQLNPKNGKIIRKIFTK